MSHHRSSREGNGNRSSYNNNNNRDKAIESVALAYLIHLRDDLDASANDVVLTANLVRSLSLSLSLSLNKHTTHHKQPLRKRKKNTHKTNILYIPRSYFRKRNVVDVLAFFLIYVTLSSFSFSLGKKDPITFSSLYLSLLCLLCVNWIYVYQHQNSGRFLPNVFYVAFLPPSLPLSLFLNYNNNPLSLNTSCVSAHSRPTL